MNRRDFLKLLGSATVALSAGGIALLEQEVYQPTKTIMLPPKGGWVAAGYGYSRIDTFQSRSPNGLANGSLFSFSEEYRTMELAMSRAMEGYEERGAPAFVIWQKPYQSPTRRVIYNSVS